MNFLKYPNHFFKIRVSQSLIFSTKYRYSTRLFHQNIKNFSKDYRKPHKPWPKSPDFKQKRLIFTYYNVGLYCLIFGICYSIVPLYKLFCEHVGLEGDLEQKDYSMKDKKIQIHRKFRIMFNAESDPDVQWEFEPIQKEVVVNAGETALAFYRAYNNENYPIIGFATYQVSPEDATLYFSKIQCFCFHQQMLNPKEELQLPLFFYLEPEIVDDPNLEKVNDIKIVYKFYKAKKQDLARLAEEELKRIEENKRILNEMREKKQEKEKNLPIK